MSPLPPQIEGQQAEGGEEGGDGRSAKRRRQAEEGSEGEGLSSEAGARAAAGPEVAKAVQQHYDEDSAVQALKQLSDQVRNATLVTLVYTHHADE